ncbi:hypothetical protein QJS10_CPA07g00479 [Acorus calamus]|uniref:Zinc knuckle CX2CX4HX4C domain-containing protein n=1 Tax=Acorus calamus TaxID=4465 RepID=A0AAV9EF48_ACOCL|nr:hypothetical protein QJS10_CPA07g00479 [Acorus calamus]
MDSSTATRSRIEFAHICVEISAHSPFSESISLGEDGVFKDIQVEYEWKPSPCRTCNTFGHSDSQCPTSSGNPPPNPTKSSAVVSSSMITYGKRREEWIPVKKKGQDPNPPHTNTMAVLQENSFSPLLEEGAALPADPGTEKVLEQPTNANISESDTSKRNAVILEKVPSDLTSQKATEQSVKKEILKQDTQADNPKHNAKQTQVSPSTKPTAKVLTK